FSVWGRLFGTWSLPTLTRPARFGVENAPATTLWSLALHPLRRCIRLLPGMRRSLVPDRHGKRECRLALRLDEHKPGRPHLRRRTIHWRRSGTEGGLTHC